MAEEPKAKSFITISPGFNRAPKLLLPFTTFVPTTSEETAVVRLARGGLKQCLEIFEPQYSAEMAISVAADRRSEWLCRR